MCHTDFQFLKHSKNEFGYSQNSVILDEHGFCMNCWLFTNSRLLRMLYMLRKRDSAKPCIDMKMLINHIKKNETTSHSFDYIKEINSNMCSSCHAWNNIVNWFFVDICTRHRTSSKNVDLYICAQTWHSVSVMGH